MIWLDLWFVVPVVFSFCGHTDTYRTVVRGHGAFELCLPSLGIPYQITQLRTQYLGIARRSEWSWGEDRRLLTQYALPIVCVVCLLPTIDVVPDVRGPCQPCDYECVEYYGRYHCVCI